MSRRYHIEVVTTTPEQEDNLDYALAILKGTTAFAHINRATDQITGADITDEVNADA